MNLAMHFSICSLSKMRVWLLVFGALSGMLWNCPLSLWKIGATIGKITSIWFTYPCLVCMFMSILAIG